MKRTLAVAGRASSVRVALTDAPRSGRARACAAKAPSTATRPLTATRPSRSAATATRRWPGCDPVATLSPLYPLQAGLPLYPEFATGPFAWRVAGVISPELRASYVMAGPGDLARLFAARPPAAILTGFDPVLEAPLEDYARGHGYRPRPVPEIHDRYGTGTLWLPAGATQDNPGGTP